MKNAKKILHMIIAQIIFMSGGLIYAERAAFYGNIGADLPENFSVTSKSADGMSWQLANATAPVDAIVRIYAKNRYKSAEEAVKNTLKVLNLQNESENFRWRNTGCTIASFKGNLMGKSTMGYALGITVPSSEEKAVFLAWYDSKHNGKYDSFVTSFLDSVLVDEGSYFEAGPVTQYLFPAEKKDLNVELEIEGRKITSQLSSNDKEASSYLISREYEVLCMYYNKQNWQEAWKRYYRMIFKDSYERLQKVSFDIYNEISPLCTDDTDLAQKLLSWTQDFKYEREKNSSDFAPLPSMILGDGSDCDSRSMLLCVLLTSMNQDAVMMVSAKYAHAMAAITSDHKGHSFKHNNKNYLMGETTVKGLTWGKIAQEHDNSSNWIFIDFTE